METKRRSGISIMLSLIGLIKPLIHIMLLAIFLGVIGYMCAISLTILASQILLAGLGVTSETGLLSLSIGKLCAILIVVAVMRGFLHYAEQYCNHFIAFKLLAIIRHKVFAVLRKLCPAKLEGKDRGNLISIITTDIELLEVFYAHTISPIAIASLTSLIMLVFIGSYSGYAAILAAAAYILIGIVIPIINGRLGADEGLEFRNDFGELNSFVLDSLRGVDETIQYGCGLDRSSQMTDKSLKLSRHQAVLSKYEGIQRAITNGAILVFSFAMLALSLFLFNRGQLEFSGVITCTVAMMGSFGPVVALSSLSNNLHQTLASGQRVLDLLAEKPQVEEIEGGAEVSGDVNVVADKVDFAYENEVILDDFSAEIMSGRLVGIHGSSGSGKSTFLKLIMRFWDVNKGQVKVADEDVRNINTNSLRDVQSYVTQETHLFHDSIANNIAIAKPEATREEIIEAAKKASIHEFIEKLPQGYDTNVGELGDTLSGGEKQRIGIARAFLHDAPLMLLDEPTSNLDSLNEGIILKSLAKECKGKTDKTVVLVSHRKSTLRAMDQIIEF